MEAFQVGNHPLHHPLLYCALPRRLPLLLPGKFETVKDRNRRILPEESELGIFHYHHILTAINNSHPAELRCHEDGGALRTSQGSRVTEGGERQKNLADIHPFFLSVLPSSPQIHSLQTAVPRSAIVPHVQNHPLMCASVLY